MPAPIISTYNYLWIRFKTDGSVQNRGFLANYSTFDIGKQLATRANEIPCSEFISVCIFYLYYARLRRYFPRSARCN